MSINDYCFKIPLNEFHVMKLSEDPIFNRKEIDFKHIEEEIKKIGFDIGNTDIINIESDLKLFILTLNALNRLRIIKNAFIFKFPVLLEGPTGTSKTKSVEILCNLMNETLIRFNLSLETTIEDLFGRLVSNKESWGSFSFQLGPFVDAFYNGKWLLLDEINLAPQTVLQCMEAALDSHLIFLDVPGKGIVKYEQHPNFRIIATQNPNDGKFIMKREELTIKFLSRFIPIEFPEISRDELYTIALKQAEFYNYKNDEFISDLIDFHYMWIHRDDVAKSAHYFTIREITGTINAVQNHKCPFDAIMTFYGIQYPMETREIMFRLIEEKYKHLMSESLPYQIPDSFPKCFHNKSLIATLKYIDLVFKSQGNVLLIGKEGSGLTQIARWAAEYYSKKYFCFICTPETTIADWIGRMVPVPKSSDYTDLIIWQDGPLTKAIKEGMCMVLDSLEFAPPNVSEKLNGLLDQKSRDGNMKFNIPENPTENQIDINSNFKLICTANVDKIDSLSPALSNRMVKIYVDDQLYKLDYNDKKDCITFFIDQELDESAKSIISPDLIETMIENLDTDDLNMSQFAKICKTTARLLPYCEDTDPLILIDFVKKLTDSSCNKLKIPDKLKKNLLKEFSSEQSENEEPFYYEDSETLKDLMAIICACSKARIHLCLVGQTGIGKTSMAVAFSEKTAESQGRGECPFQLFSFNMESQLDDIYGTFSIDKGKPKISKGPLYHAIEDGQVFIADEFNLAEDSTILSLAPALESSSGSEIIIPGLGEELKFHEKFLFIACQNDIKTTGRKLLPQNISKKLRIFEYPSPALEDLQSNCRIIAKSELLCGDETISQHEVQAMANFINEINKSQINYIANWSMRDVRKIFRRYSDSLINPQKYLNFSIVHHILFYILSPLSEKESKEIIDDILKNLTECFYINNDEIKKIKDCYYANPSFENINGISLLLY